MSFKNIGSECSHGFQHSKTFKFLTKIRLVDTDDTTVVCHNVHIHNTTIMYPYFSQFAYVGALGQECRISLLNYHLMFMKIIYQQHISDHLGFKISAWILYPFDSYSKVIKWQCGGSERNTSHWLQINQTFSVSGYNLTT